MIRLGHLELVVGLVKIQLKGIKQFIKLCLFTYLSVLVFFTNESVAATQRTIILIEGTTSTGQDLFIRGGIDVNWSNANRGTQCTGSTVAGGNQNIPCSLPITNNNLIHAYTMPWRTGDNFLDWGKLVPSNDGREPLQTGVNSKGETAVGTPAVWTTNATAYTKKIYTVGNGFTPLNTYKEGYWMLDVDMECNSAVNGWFEFKTYISNTPSGVSGWEADSRQTQFMGFTPPPFSATSKNHMGRCGMINVFRRGFSEPVDIKQFPAGWPAATFVATQMNASNGVLFDASASTNTSLYRWDFNGDGTYDVDWLAINSTSFNYASAGTYKARLWARDDLGRDSFLVKNIVVLAVPNVVGQTQANAQTNLIAAGFSVGGITTQTSTSIPAGNVISQSATLALSSSAINLVVSSGSSAQQSSSSSSPSSPIAFHLRGTHNQWLEGDLFIPIIGSTTNYEICRNFIDGDANGGPRFKVDPNGGWGDGFPSGDVAAGGWTKIVINGTTRTIESMTTHMATNCAIPSSIFHLRGTHNQWLEGDVFTPVFGSTTNYEICRNFTIGDANGGPRFKVDPNGGWGNDSFPTGDVTAGGWTKVVINGSTGSVVSTTTNMAANCAVPQLALHLRGTQNQTIDGVWLEGDLFTPVAGSTTDYEICRNFTVGDAVAGPRFKVDPNGGWGGDEFPLLGNGIPVSGWTKITVNPLTQSITAKIAQGVNCSAPPSIYQLRGTHLQWNNVWLEGDYFTPVEGSTTNFEACRNFTTGDSVGGPRFKVDPNGGWGGDEFPFLGQGVSVSGWTQITINGPAKTFSVNTGLNENCRIFPVAPVSLTAQLNGASINLSWTSSDVGTYYNLERRSAADTSGTPDSIVKTDVTTLTDVNLSSGKSYFYRVQACMEKPGGIIMCSEWVNAPKPVLIAPDIPTFINTNQNGSTISVGWQAPNGATSYDIQKNGIDLKTVDGAITVITDVITSNANGHTYNVRACIDAGVDRACSARTTATPPVNIAPPAPTVINVSPNGAAAAITWLTVPNATDYELFRSDKGIIFKGNATAFSDSGLIFGTSYSYQVRACIGTNCSAVKESDIFTAIPLAPIPITAQVSDSLIQLTWPAQTGVTRYELSRNNMTPVTLTTASFSDSNVVFPNSYVYTLKACANNVCSASVSTAPIVMNVFPAVPFPPGFISANLTSLTSADVQWEKSFTAATFYILQRNGTAIQTIPNNSVTDTGIPGVGLHIYGVKACNAKGCSATITTNVIVTVASPKSFKAVASALQVSLSWEPSLFATEYKLTRTFTGSNGLTTELVSFDGATSKIDSIPFANVGKTYTYTLTACGSNRTICSSPIDVNINTLSIPSNFSGTVNGTSINLTWGGTLASTSYKIVRNFQFGSTLNTTNVSLTDQNLSPGSYTYMIASCNSLGCSAWSNPITLSIAAPFVEPVVSHEPPVTPSGTAVTKSTELTNGVVNSPAIMDSPESTLVGSLSGQFRVNESGAATYNVPITVADGIAGVTPRINIGYSSQSGNGLLGKGWAISGLSEISRCRQTLSQDGVAKPITWTSEDRFCLDGQRLILVEGTTDTYKTEIDTFVTVTAMGSSANPDSFIVQAKDGSVSTYGGTSLAKVTTTNGTLSWNISHFEDNVGNGINYSYEGNLSNHHIKQIDYAFGTNGSADAKIVFNYEARNDQVRGYVAGFELTNSQRLKSIVSSNGSSILRFYRINYEYAPAGIGGYSRVTSLQECADSSTTKCYKPTTFTWFTPTVTNEFSKNLGSIAHTGGKVRVTNQVFLDINGNGIQDYVWSTLSGALYYSLDAAAIPSANVLQMFNVGVNNIPKFEAIDYNGDSKQDLFIYRPDEKKWVLYLSVYDPVSKEWKIERQNIEFSFSKNIKVGDVNSDGLMDVIEFSTSNTTLKIYKLQKSNKSPTSNTYYEFGAPVTVNLIASKINTTNPQTSKLMDDVFTLGDFNGDGKVDLIAHIDHPVTDICQRIACTISSYTLETFLDIDTAGTNTFSSVIDASETTNVIAPDINGDGLQDIAYLVNKTWSYKINTGAGFLSPVPIFVSGDLRSKNQNLSFADLDHDGFQEIIWRDTEYVLTDAGTFDIESMTWEGRVGGDVLTVFMKKWNPVTAAFSDTSVLLEGANADVNYEYRFMDVNGDGWVDNVATAIYGKNTTTLMNIKGFSADTTTNGYTPEGFLPSSQITAITNGVGNVTKISYEPMSRSKHYFPIGDIKVISTQNQLCNPFIFKEDDPFCPTVIRTVDTSAFYTAINDPFAGLINDEDKINVPVLEVTGSMPIVSQADSSAPVAADPNALNSVVYQYKRLRMQAAGRGMLGFESVATLDKQTDVITETMYRQDWPYIGSPRQTIIKTNSKNALLSKAVNTWNRKVKVNGNTKRYQPFLEKSVEQTYWLNTSWTGFFFGTLIDKDGNINGLPLQTVTTDTVMENDDYGNVHQITVKTEGNNDSLVKSTVNEYFGDPWKDQMGRLKASTITSNLNGDTTSRKVSFEYYPRFSPENGLLMQETVLDEFNQPFLTTNYVYDARGNKTEVRVKGMAEPGREETRKTTNKYDDNGRYLVSSTKGADDPNGLSQTSLVSGRDPITGQPTKVSDLNKVESQIFYDAMGKEYLRVDGTGAWSRKDTSFCVSGCPAGAKYFTLTRVAGGGQSKDYFDLLGRVIRSSKVGFDGRNINVDTEYDNLGRIARQSVPYFEGDAISWTANTYDVLGRVVQINMPDGSLSTSNFTVGLATFTNDKGQQRIEARNGLGQLSQVTDNAQGTVSYTYNPNGALKTAATKSPDHTAEVTVRMCYDKLGRKIGMLDPDKGGWLATSTDCSALSSSSPGWWKYTYNAFDELITQKDPKGQIITMSYDALGRMIKRQDEDQTRWFYDKNPDGSSYVGSQGKLMAVIVRKNTTAITDCIKTQDLCTQFYYDQFARPTYTLARYPNDSKDYVSTTKYDSIGRVYESRDALNGSVILDSGVQTQYNAFGYAYRTVDIAPVDGSKGILSQIIKTNARGQVTDELRNNGAFVISNAYNPQTGLMESQKATSALAAVLGLKTTIQDESYRWDTLGNLSFRYNKNANVGSTINKDLAESFCYDGLNRLVATVKNIASTSPSCGGLADVKYDGLGNITFKKDIGTYTYGTNAGPHAVTNITLGSTATNYTYDANGNQKDGDGRTITYTTYDMAKTIAKNGNTTSFSYGDNRARWQRVDTKSGVTTTTTYLGNIEKIQTSSSTDIEWKRYVGGAIFTFKTNSNNQLITNGINTAYVFNDYLGSVDVVTDANGKVTHSLSFDPWGARRDGETWGSLTDAQRITALKVGTGSVFVQPITMRGFTGHEMVDDMGIIHMNGRIYDAKIARFLQADPYIQEASNTQSYNRYSYTINNPLNATDPSGFSFKKLIGLFVAVVGTMLCPGVCTQAALMWIGAVSGAVSAAVNGGNILLGAMTGMLTAGMGGAGPGIGGFFARGVVGGVASGIMGGKFGHGFISAGLGGAIGPTGNVVADALTSAMIGGTVSVITGGKFENGAGSALIAYLAMAGAQKYAAGGAVETRESGGGASADSADDNRKGRGMTDRERRHVEWSKKSFCNDDGTCVSYGVKSEFEMSSSSDSPRLTWRKIDDKEWQEFYSVGARIPKTFGIEIQFAEQYGNLEYKFQEIDVYYRTIGSPTGSLDIQIFDRVPINNYEWRSSIYDNQQYARTRYRVCSNVTMLSSCEGGN